jgi:hypothetical protein
VIFGQCKTFGLQFDQYNMRGFLCTSGFIRLLSCWKMQRYRSDVIQNFLRNILWDTDVNRAQKVSIQSSINWDSLDKFDLSFKKSPNVVDALRKKSQINEQKWRTNLIR